MKTAALCLLLAGCAGSIGIKDMSPEQIRAMVSDKSCTAVCSNVQTTFGTSKFVFLSCDKTVLTNGGMTVDANCLAAMNTQTAIKPGAVIEVAVPMVINPQVVTPNVTK